MLNEARYFARMMIGCYEFVRTPPERDPVGLVRKHLENREANFLDLMRRVVFANASNPYHTLFRWAGWSYMDLEKAVRNDGLETTLEALRTAGVCLSHDEFKGKKPIQRPGGQIAANPGCFTNPLVRGGIENTSSGSRSRGTITRTSAEYQIYREAQDALFMEQFLSPGRVIGAVLPVLPSTVWLHRSLSCMRRGAPIEQWFSLGGAIRESGHYQLLTRLLILEARMLGLKLRFPTYLPRNDFSPAARWIGQRRSDGVDVLFMGPVSLAVRVAAAAVEGNIDIRGTSFLCGAEPLTQAKRAVIEGAGAEVFPRYGISELGWVGCSCRQMDKGNCVHVMRDSVAVISHRRRVPLSDVELDSLAITTLLPFAAYVLINVEMDDSGTVEPARCQCSFKAMGFTQQISDIYSYGKLTGQGITLLGGDILNILEKSLPARFGGTPADFQLVEREGSGQTITELRVNPRLGICSEQDVRNFFLSEVKRMWGGSLAFRQWSQTDSIQVAFAEPIISGNRKINPLHLLGTSRRESV